MRVSFDSVKTSDIRIRKNDLYFRGKKIKKNQGHCRNVFKIDRIFIKFDRCVYPSGQTDSEVSLYKTIAQEDLKHFARTKGFKRRDRTIEVQEYVKGQFLSWPDTEWMKHTGFLTEMGKKYSCNDFNNCGNVVFVEGKPIIIDFGL